MFTWPWSDLNPIVLLPSDSDIICYRTVNKPNEIFLMLYLGHLHKCSFGSDSYPHRHSASAAHMAINIKMWQSNNADGGQWTNKEISGWLNIHGDASFQAKLKETLYCITKQFFEEVVQITCGTNSIVVWKWLMCNCSSERQWHRRKINAWY